MPYRFARPLIVLTCAAWTCAHTYHHGAALVAVAVLVTLCRVREQGALGGEGGPRHQRPIGQCVGRGRIPGVGEETGREVYPGRADADERDPRSIVLKAPTGKLDVVEGGEDLVEESLAVLGKR